MSFWGQSFEGQPRKNGTSQDVVCYSCLLRSVSSPYSSRDASSDPKLLETSIKSDRPNVNEKLFFPKEVLHHGKKSCLEQFWGRRQAKSSLKIVLSRPVKRLTSLENVAKVRLGRARGFEGGKQKMVGGISFFNFVIINANFLFTLRLL